MANISGIGNNLLESLLPRFGQPRANTPIWDEEQRMFLTDQYTSAAGHTYYLGVRVSDRFVSIIHIGKYHNWTYIDEIDTYAFDGTERTLIGKVSFDKQFYEESVIRSSTENLIQNYIESQMRLKGVPVNRELIAQQARELVKNSYCSMLDDSNTKNRLESVKPLLIMKK